MNRILRGALVVALVALPVAASAQQQQGESRASDALRRAKSLVEKKRYKAALTVFDSLLRAEPNSRDAVLGRAQMLSWIGRISDAIRAYERWVAAHPKDVQAIERLAQVLAWAGRYDDAERLYKVLALGGSAESERGLARLAAWRGNMLESERQWREIIARRPNDAEALVGLAYVLRWTNRPREARAVLMRAVAADPTNGDARDLLRWVEAALAPHVDPTVALREDTDGNRVTTIGATAAVAAPWDGELAVHAQRRAANVGGTSAEALNAALSASRATGRYGLRGSLGAARFDDGGAAAGIGTRDVLTASASASATLGSRVNVLLAAGRQPFDETAPIIRRGIVTTTVGGGGSFALTRRVTAAAEIERASLTGAAANTRVGGSGWIRWRAPHVLSLVANVRGFGYESDPGEGYFAPRRYVLADVGAQLAVGRELGWSLTLDGGWGAQTFDTYAGGSETQPAARGSIALALRPRPGLEWAVTGNVSSAVSPAASTLTSYRASGWGMRGRMSF